MEVEITPSARKHGVSDASIRHAVDNAVASTGAGEDPYRILVLGPDTAGNLLEVVAIVRDDGDLVAIHAMSMRAKFQPLLTETPGDTP